MEVYYEVFFSTIDTSPKYRKKIIEVEIIRDKEFIESLCENFQLNLIKEIYFTKINRNTYNSKKRDKLKEQEIILIKKLMVYKPIIDALVNLENTILDLNKLYIQYFHSNFIEDHYQDKQYIKILFKKIINDYFEEIERIK